MNPSVINPLNDVPLVNSTQMLTTSAQVPAVSQVPVAASTPIAPIVSQVPVVSSTVQPVQSVIPTDQHYATQTTLNTLVDEDYRLGRGILDDFRPNAYKTQIGVVGKTTTNVVTSSTPVVNATGSSATLKDFL